MGTKNISEMATTTGRIVKHINPTEDDDKIRLNNYEVVPKLPSVKACCTVYNNVLKICFSVRSITVDVHLI
jgi:hypothetical protein